MTVASPTKLSYPTLHHINDPSMSSETQNVEEYERNFRPRILPALDSQAKRKHGEKEGLSGRRSTSASQANSQGGNGTKHDSGLQLGVSASASDHIQPKRNRKFKNLVFLRHVSTFDAQSVRKAKLLQTAHSMVSITLSGFHWR